MSADEVSALREDIAELRAIVSERARLADSNSTLLKAVVGAVALQIVMSVYIAGQKTQMLDRLSQDVMAIQTRMDNKEVK